MQLVYGVVLGEPARRRLFPEGAVGILGELPAEIDVEGAYGLVDVPGNAVVGCGVINGGRGGDPLPLEKLERRLRADIKNAKRRWKGLAASPAWCWCWRTELEGALPSPLEDLGFPPS